MSVHIRIVNSNGDGFAPTLSDDVLLVTSSNNQTVYVGASNGSNYLMVNSQSTWTSNLGASNLSCSNLKVTSNVILPNNSIQNAAIAGMSASKLIGNVVASSCTGNAATATTLVANPTLTGNVTANTFVGSLTGNAATATTATTAGTCTGNAATATIATTLVANPTLTGTVTAGTFTGSGTGITGLNQTNLAPGSFTGTGGIVCSNAPTFVGTVTTTGSIVGIGNGGFASGGHPNIGGICLYYNDGNGAKWMTSTSGAIFGFYPDTVLGTISNNAVFTISRAGNIYAAGSISKSSGTFDIVHPLNPNKRLVHSFIEGPRCDLIYRGDATLLNGTVTVNIDLQSTQTPDCAMTEGTFVELCTNPRCFLQNVSSFDNLIGSIAGNILTIRCENTSYCGDVTWMVIAERCDPHIKEWERTNVHGYLVTEYTK